ncbi:conserved hypothetical protein [Ricinus communis]|uniref:Uncharacterized protein n=1 Tax=Ricinus communis TaxID=3988 RepID=B9S436_RICCO|nr:conserved hypothetical protein [Ricinus communis]
MEGEGSSEIETNTDSLDNSIIFHVIKNTVFLCLFRKCFLTSRSLCGSVLQDITLEYDSLKEEYEEMMAVAQAEAKASTKRKHISRMREVRIGIKRFDKLISTITGLETALQLIISGIPGLESFILILGASPLRPQQVYELSFSHGNSLPGAHTDFAKTKAAEGLSRKVIRALITKGAGSGSYPGPTKLFLLVKAPSSFHFPLQFLPKRDFRYSKKIVPVKLRVKCKSQNLQMDALIMLVKSAVPSAQGTLLRMS